MNKEVADITKIIFVTGEQKNAGKTTFLKHLLFEARTKGKNFVVSSVGIDGEKTDAVYGNSKPQIVLEKGEMVVTSEEAIKLSEGDFDILNVFENNKYQQNERSVLAKAKRLSAIEVVASGDNLVLSDVLSAIKKDIAPDFIFVDGAADRITQVASSQNTAFYYVVKISNANFYSAVDNIKKLDALSRLPLFREQKDGKKRVKIEGALTSNKINKLKDEIEEIVINDFSKVFLSFAELKILLKKRTVSVNNQYDLKSFIIIDSEISKDKIIKEFQNKNLLSKIKFNPYENQILEEYI
ncbi:MAG: hypothetical protein AB7U85_08680 [Alphaproteobacteria bacterium]